ncbi:STM4015 family protein [Nonomuraea jiangxiensis]|uniref:Leucine Rich repeat-containing protein n=1 Tax=Nonomuraea jiangxiensis TaxID=633440 RepID=A0A1G8UPY8_9ACTN|nr:STM4015 family protein [Nonomuraea jiangxiensis]SDJ55956.1 Leucine Rich repeat-containing protein [Nonomuraea jiangxiensis]
MVYDFDDNYHEGYAGLPEAHVPWDQDEPQPEADAVAWYLSASEWHDEGPKAIGECFDWFFEHVDTAKVRAIVIGGWEECYSQDSAPIVSRLADNANRLPGLRWLFLGDISSEQAEISWIQQSDITPLLEAYPKLERLEVRGGSGLGLRPVRHESLRMLRIESGGLPGAVVRAVGECDLPALEHLELWLGVTEYGGDATVGDCAAILSGERLPRLRYLGLQDSEIADEIAAAVAAAPVVARLETLSLAYGTLGNDGAEALLSGQPLTHLRTLDLEHHYLDEAMAARVTAALPGVEVDLSDPQGEDEENESRYVAVSE